MSKDLPAQNQTISDNIRAFGWHCLHVFPTQDNQDKFTYSIGFGESYGAPEVLIFGVEREKAHALLHECAYLLKNGHTIQPEVEDENILTGGYSVIFKCVRPEHFDEYLGTAVRYYQDKPFAAVVMFFPDRQHRFPWDEGYDYIPAGEPLAIV
ncbi:DUF4262 domain-containing protein [Montanilutibacter psychrotolerans]|uniref:DUF4262 domain-containing protein n=1 Tax=Montanilutibacter psychrotolerans TaxID=1327343 RepID=A0A3M8SVE3_9GAMM|nr:DUF4262 domain-containing protein [Lysobacter psychrotolerans]RNF83204.1 DUF4262 domain-containing protein [Lysobacter psychrotolerans]